GRRLCSAGTRRVDGGKAVPGSCPAALRRSASPSWRKKSSSKMSERWASERASPSAWRSASGAGVCTWRSARGRAIPRARAVAVAQHDLEDAPAAAARARLVNAGDLAHRRRLLADMELAERPERAPVLVAERQVIEEVLDRVQAEARQLGSALRADAAHRLRGLGERGERHADRGRRRPVLRP